MMSLLHQHTRIIVRSAISSCIIASLRRCCTILMQDERYVALHVGWAGGVSEREIVSTALCMLTQK